jgi:hypothetical protein
MRTLAARHFIQMKKLIWAIVFIAFLTWNFTSDIFVVTEPKPIRKVTATRAWHLFGKRKIWTLGKSEQVFNQKGQTIEQLFYDGDVCNSKYVYTYNEFDSLETIVWLTGRNLTPQKIKIWTYDRLNREFQNLVYEVSKAKPDTFMSEKTTWYYDKLGREYMTVIEHFSDLYPESAGVTTMTDVYDAKGQVISSIFSSTHETNETQYVYNERGFVKLQTGGFMDDSILFETNYKGQVLERKEIKNGVTIDQHKYWYDKNGNEIKTFLDNEGGQTFEFKFDKHNRLVKEYRPGSFLFILKPCVTYSYDYY